MLAEDYVVENATCTENVTDRMRLCAHVLNVYDFRRHIAWSTASNEQIVWIVSYRRQAEINYYRLFA